MVLNKKGVPQPTKETLKGCVLFENRVFVPLNEVATFCMKYATRSGGDLARVFHTAAQKTDQNKKLPKVTPLEDSVWKQITTFLKETKSD